MLDQEIDWIFVILSGFELNIHPYHILIFQEALRLARYDEEQLLKARKLVLVVDLDMTLIHTTVQPVPKDMKVMMYLVCYWYSYKPTHFFDTFHNDEHKQDEHSRDDCTPLTSIFDK